MITMPVAPLKVIQTKFIKPPLTNYRNDIANMFAIIWCVINSRIPVFCGTLTSQVHTIFDEIIGDNGVVVSTILDPVKFN